MAHSTWYVFTFMYMYYKGWINPWRLVTVVTKCCMSVPKILVLGVKLASYHPSGTKSCEVASRFVELNWIDLHSMSPNKVKNFGYRTSHNQLSYVITYSTLLILYSISFKISKINFNILYLR